MFAFRGGLITRRHSNVKPLGGDARGAAPCLGSIVDHQSAVDFRSHRIAIAAWPNLCAFTSNLAAFTAAAELDRMSIGDDICIGGHFIQCFEK